MPPPAPLTHFGVKWNGCVRKEHKGASHLPRGCGCNRGVVMAVSLLDSLAAGSGYACGAARDGNQTSRPEGPEGVRGADYCVGGGRTRCGL